MSDRFTRVNPFKQRMPGRPQMHGILQSVISEVLKNKHADATHIANALGIDIELAALALDQAQAYLKEEERKLNVHQSKLDIKSNSETSTTEENDDQSAPTDV